MSKLRIERRGEHQILVWPDESCRPAGIAELELWAEAQALREEVAALRARMVVPDGYALVPVEPTVAMRMPWKTMRGHSWYAKYKAMVEVAPHLNGKMVGEGTLREALRIILEYVPMSVYIDTAIELAALLDGEPT